MLEFFYSQPAAETPEMWGKEVMGDNCFTLRNTVEPPNKGHIGTRSFVHYREVSFFQRLKCTGIIVGTSRFVLYREVFIIWSVLNSP